MNFILMLSVIFLACKATEGNPDNSAGSSADNSDTGSIASLDEALSETSKDDDQGARSDATAQSGEGGDKSQVGQKKSEPEPLILGKFKTNDDLAKAYQELERKFTEATTKQPTTQKQDTQEEWVELSDEQIKTLEESDPEAYAWYLKERENRKINELVDEKLKPIKEKLAPIDELQQKELEKQFFSHEESMLDSTKRMFGDEFQALDKQRQDASFLKKVFDQMPKPLADSIIMHHNQGSPEYSRQLLLGQIQVYNLRQNRRKSSMSVNPDAGSSSGKTSSTESAATLEEAGDLAAKELGIR